MHRIQQFGSERERENDFLSWSERSRAESIPSREVGRESVPTHTARTSSAVPAEEFKIKCRLILTGKKMIFSECRGFSQDRREKLGREMKTLSSFLYWRERRDTYPGTAIIGVLLA
jgi:hypothetical protein